MPFLRHTRAVLALLVFTPLAAEAAPASRKPPPAPNSSQGPKPVAKPGAKNAPAGLKNTSARSPTAHLAPASGPQRIAAPRSASIGSPTEGHLLNGAHLADAPYLRVYPAHASGDVRWGLEPLVGLVDRAARTVRKQYGDAVLSVGHLSKAGGGELDRHASHESGRDADVGFYVKNAAGKPILSENMVAFQGDGTARTWPGAHFDDARNWALVAAMVTDPQARVTHLFVATPIRERLLAYAARTGAPLAVRTKASEVLAQPHGALPHDDHFHVRIACPAGMEKCIEMPLARRYARGSAVASNGHPARPGMSPHGATASAAAAHAAPAPARPSAAAPAPAKPADRPASRAERTEESASSESLIPSLSPAIPGLDSAVIPAPLGGIRSTWGAAKDPAPAPPISDPDGVLESN